MCHVRLSFVCLEASSLGGGQNGGAGTSQTPGEEAMPSKNTGPNTDTDTDKSAQRENADKWHGSMTRRHAQHSIAQDTVGQLNAECRFGAARVSCRIFVCLDASGFR